MNKLLQNNYVVGVLYFFLGLIPFGKLPFTFFLQDEWAIFGNFLYWEKAGLSWWDRLFVYEQATHIIPFSTLSSYLSYMLFGVNFFAYGMLSIIIHVLNSFLVFFFTNLFFTKRISFLAGLLFLINSISHQAITWTATTIGTAGSTFFVLLTLISFTKYTLAEKGKPKSLFLSLIFLLIALLFKETAIFLFLFLPLFWIVLKRKIVFTSLVKNLLPFFILGIFYLLIRVFFILFVKTTIATPEAIAQPSIFVYFYRIFTIPLKFITQSIVSVDYILVASRTLLAVGYPHLNIGGSPNPYIVESVGSDIITYIMAFLILFISFILFNKLKTRKQSLIRKFIPVSFLFISLSALPFIFIPGKAGYFSLIDGRHLYITSIFSSILVTVIFYSLRVSLEKKRALILLLYIPLFLYISFHAYTIRSEINTRVGDGFIRKNILQEISKKYPILPTRAVFYIESDKAYYGLPPEEKILPFQSGFGQVLLVWYNAHGQDMPACMYKDQYLYVLLSEDYKECDGRGFGYFRNMEKLKNTVEKNKLDENAIIAFSYTSSNGLLEDITMKVRRELQ